MIKIGIIGGHGDFLPASAGNDATVFSAGYIINF